MSPSRQAYPHSKHRWLRIKRIRPKRSSDRSIPGQLLTGHLTRKNQSSRKSPALTDWNHHRPIMSAGDFLVLSISDRELLSITHHNHRALLWFSGGPQRLENDPVDHFREGGPAGPGTGGGAINKQIAPGKTRALLATMQNVVHLPCLLRLSKIQFDSS